MTNEIKNLNLKQDNNLTTTTSSSSTIERSHSFASAYHVNTFDTASDLSNSKDTNVNTDQVHILY